jgi:hypothetical protein
VKITLEIRKENASDCSFDCPFRDNWSGDNPLCTLFNKELEHTRYNNETTACLQCYKYYEKSIEGV